jgi:hypothetical protein
LGGGRLHPLELRRQPEDARPRRPVLLQVDQQLPEATSLWMAGACRTERLGRTGIEVEQMPPFPFDGARIDDDLMNDMTDPVTRSWWYRHPWLTVTASGVLGATIAFAVVRSMMPDEQLEGYFAIGAGLPAVGLVMSTIAGFLLGVLAGILLIRAGSDEAECPRCGSLNKRGVTFCRACQLPLS